MNKLIKILIISFIFLFPSNKAFSQAVMNDNLVLDTLKDKEFQQIITNTNYNYQNTEKIPIKLKFTDKISTKNNLLEGDYLIFKVRDDVFYDNKIIIHKDDLVKAKLKTYITRGFNGIPGQIIIDDFEIQGIDSRKLSGAYIKKGANLTLLVLPIKWLLTPLQPTGSFTNLILGGHSKLSPRDKIIIYYYPKWHTK